MQYFGGKAKIAKPLAAFLNSQLQDEQPFVDLFCGSCNVISKIDDNRERVANDIHYHLIEMWKAVQNGQGLPSEVSEEDYKAMKNTPEAFPAWLVGFTGFGLSYSGKWFGGYARNSRGDDYCANAKNSTNTKARSNSSNAKNSTTKKNVGLQDVAFHNGTYSAAPLPPSSLVYCDIPYKGTTKYSTGSFCHDTFYEWAVRTQAEGHTVLVSEYKHNLPDGWEIVWEHESKKDIRNAAGEQEATIEILMQPKLTKEKQ